MDYKSTGVFLSRKIALGVKILKEDYVSTRWKSLWQIYCPFWSRTTLYYRSWMTLWFRVPPTLLGRVRLQRSDQRLYYVRVTLSGYIIGSYMIVMLLLKKKIKGTCLMKNRSKATETCNPIGRLGTEAKANASRFRVCRCFTVLGWKVRLLHFTGTYSGPGRWKICMEKDQLRLVYTQRAPEKIYSGI